MTEKRKEVDLTEALKSTMFVQEALINMLEQKKVISKAELMKELERLGLQKVKTGEKQ